MFTKSLSVLATIALLVLAPAARTDEVPEEYRETVRTYFSALGFTSVDVPIGPDGRTDPKALAEAVDGDTFAVAIQSPNFFGVVEDWKVGSDAAHAKGARSVAVVAEAVSAVSRDAGVENAPLHPRPT